MSNADPTGIVAHFVGQARKYAKIHPRTALYYARRARQHASSFGHPELPQDILDLCEELERLQVLERQRPSGPAPEERLLHAINRAALEAAERRLQRFGKTVVDGLTESWERYADLKQRARTAVRKALEKEVSLAWTREKVENRVAELVAKQKGLYDLIVTGRDYLAARLAPSMACGSLQHELLAVSNIQVNLLLDGIDTDWTPERIRAHIDRVLDEPRSSGVSRRRS